MKKIVVLMAQEYDRGSHNPNGVERLMAARGTKPEVRDEANLVSAFAFHMRMADPEKTLEEIKKGNTGGIHTMMERKTGL